MKFISTICFLALLLSVGCAHKQIASNNEGPSVTAPSDEDQAIKKLPTPSSDLPSTGSVVSQIQIQISI